MSKAGASRKPDKQAEVMSLVNEAAEKHKQEEMQAVMQRAQRAEFVFAYCHHKVRLACGGIFSLPGEMLGAEIGERMLRQAYEAMLRQVAEQRAAGEIDVVKPGDIRLASVLQ